MDRPDRSTAPSLQPLARELAASERLQSFADDLRGAAARVSEPGLPLLLAALHLHLDRALLMLLPEDADARDAAEAASWYLGEERVALFPSRGVGWDSGLEPPPHLVGERARALDVLAAGGLVCASAAALAEGSPPPETRPARLDLAVGDEPGIDSLAEHLALAGYERVERVEERGQFAVRGGIVDVFPTTGREPAAYRAVRRRDRGDPRLLAVHAARASSGRGGDRLPGCRAAARPRPEPSCPTTGTSRRHPGRPRPAARPRHPTSCSSPRRSRGSGRRNRSPRRRFGDAALLDPFPRGQPLAFEAQRPAVAARGLAEAEQELASFVRAGQRVVVAFPHRGDALRTAEPAPPARGRLAGGRATTCRPTRGSTSPSRRPAAASSGATSASSCCRTRRSSASAPRAATPRSAAPSSRSPTCAPATTSSTRTTASASCSASRRRRSRGSRATTSSSPSAARTASTCRTSRSARSRATSAPTRRRPRSRSSAARRGSCSRAARGSPCRSSPAS